MIFWAELFPSSAAKTTQQTLFWGCPLQKCPLDRGTYEVNAVRNLHVETAIFWATFSGFNLC
jgi:hypothetical protein